VITEKLTFIIVDLLSAGTAFDLDSELSRNLKGHFVIASHLALEDVRKVHIHATLSTFIQPRALFSIPARLSVLGTKGHYSTCVYRDVFLYFESSSESEKSVLFGIFRKYQNQGISILYGLLSAAQLIWMLRIKMIDESSSRKSTIFILKQLES
jgi:hypothetical protein